MRRFISIVLIIISLPIGLVKAEEGAQMELESGAAKLIFSANGEITRFLIDDTVFLDSQGLSGMTVLYSDAQSQWEATHWDELAADSVRIHRSDNALTLSYPSFGGKNIQADVHITCDVNGFIIDTSIVNETNGVVVGAKVLRMRGFKELGGTLYFPDRAGQKMQSPFKKLLSNMYGFKYPVPMSAQYLTYSTGDKTWSIQVLDQTMSYKKLWLGDFTYGFEAELYCFLESSLSTTLPSIRLNAYLGDWHMASDQYREWFESWAKTVERSPLILEMPTIASAVILARPEEDLTLRDVTKDQELKTYAAAKDVMTRLRLTEGFEGCELVGWHGMGHDTDYPIHDVSEAMGGTEGLKELSSLMDDLGMQVGYYTNARLGNIKSPIYDEIQLWMVRPEDGVKTRERYGGEWFEILCPMAEGFIRIMEDKARELAGTYHADFIQLDQVGAAQCYLCFDATHGHTSPATAWAEGYVEFIDRVIAAGREYNPDFWTWCEGAWEGAGQHLDLQQGGFWKFNSYSEYMPELYRYTFPDQPLMGTAWLGGVCMWVGATSNPAVKLMKDYKEFYTTARFMDTYGLFVTGDVVNAKWHIGDHALVIIAHNDETEAGSAVFELDSSFVQLPDTFNIKNMNTGYVTSADPNTILTLTLQPGEINGLYIFW